MADPADVPRTDDASWRTLTAFFGTTFVVSWSAWFLAGALDTSRDPATGHSVSWTLLVYLGTFAPAIVALAMTAQAGRQQVAALFGQVVRIDVPMRRYLLAFLFMFAVKLGVAAAYRLGLGAWPRLGYESVALLAVATIFSTPGQAGEELGWRGFALPRLGARIGVAWASIVLGVAWAFWHLPLFIIPGVDKSGQAFPVWGLGVVALSVAMAFLWLRTGRSLLPVMLMHAGVNNLGSIIPGAIPKASNIWTWHASPQLWLTTGVLWLAAAGVLVAMYRGRHAAEPL